MALQLGALRDALLDAGATPEKAQKAAEELAGYENRFASLENKMAALTAMVSINIAMSAGIIWLIVRVLEKLP